MVVMVPVTQEEGGRWTLTEEEEKRLSPVGKKEKKNVLIGYCKDKNKNNCMGILLGKFVSNRGMV